MSSWSAGAERSADTAVPRGSTCKPRILPSRRIRARARPAKRRLLRTQSKTLTRRPMRSSVWRALVVLECGGKRSATPLWSGIPAARAADPFTKPGRTSHPSGKAPSTLRSAGALHNAVAPNHAPEFNSDRIAVAARSLAPGLPNDRRTAASFSRTGSKGPSSSRFSAPARAAGVAAS